MCLLDQGQDGLHCWCAHIAKEGKNFVLVDQPFGIPYRELGLVVVVEADEPNAAAVDPPSAIHFGEPGQGTIAVVQTELTGAAAQGGRLPQKNLIACGRLGWRRRSPPGLGT